MIDQPALSNAYCLIIGLCLTLVFSHWLVWHRLIVPTSRQLKFHHQALQRLYDSESLKTSMIDAMRDAVILIDENHRIVEFNAAAKRIFAYQDEACVLGCNCITTLIPEQLQKAYTDYLQRQPTLPDAQPLTCAALRVDNNETFPAEWVSHPVTLDNRRLLMLQVRDLSTNKQIEAELIRQQQALHQADKMSALGTVLAGVAHELNNPLAIVVGRAIMLEAQPVSPPVASAIGKIRDAAERCARIVKTFISLAKQSASEPSWVQCNEIIESVSEVSEQSLRNHDIDLTLELADDLPAMWADGAQLSQALMNLIVNAQQALQDSDKPRRLTISSHFEQASATLQIEIKDTGPGIAKELHSHIFEPFFTTKEVGTGMGTGLSISFSIIQSHRGTLSLCDDESNSGAHFVIRLPLAPIVREQL